MKLYKFLNKTHMDKFFETGSLKIGTLHNFSDVINHTEARGDEHEGKTSIIRKFDDDVTATANKYEPLISQFVRCVGDGSVTFAAGSQLKLTTLLPNSYIFCMSNNFSPDLFSRWYDDSSDPETKYDSCYVILDHENFFRAISNAIKDFATHVVTGDVVYTDIPVPYNTPDAFIPSQMLKEKNKYSWQCEGRAIWNPKDPTATLSPMIIDVPDAIRYCKRYAVRSNGVINYFA